MRICEWKSYYYKVVWSCHVENRHVIIEARRMLINERTHGRYLSYFFCTIDMPHKRDLLFTDKCLTSPTSLVVAAILLPRLSFRFPPVFPLRTLDCHHHHHYHHVTLAVPRLTLSGKCGSPYHSPHPLYTLFWLTPSSRRKHGKMPK